MPPPPPPPPPPLQAKDPSPKLQQKSGDPSPSLSMMHPPRPPLVSRGGSDGSRGMTSKSSSHVAFKDLASSSQQHLQSSQHNNNNISVDTIVSSQFENEAETHILAALEIEERDQSNLLGEGIDGMDDYSEDDEDDGDNLHQERGGGTSARSRTYSTDSFLKRVHMQNDNPNYQNTSYEVESSASPPASPTASHRHKRYTSSTRGSGYLPSVPDGSALNDYLERNDLDNDKDTSFIEPMEGGGGDDDNNMDSSKGESKGEGPVTGFDEPVNIKTATNATDNVNTMAQRLAQLQRRGSRRMSKMSSSNVSSSEYLVDDHSSHDKLIGALNSVDSASRGFFGKMRYEWNLLIVPKLPTFRQHISHVLLFLVIPSLAVAAILFYMFDNPMAGDSGTSISWWIIFVGVRQAITVGLTWIGQVFWVEILALRSRVFNTIVGPYVSLAIIQSSG